MPEKIPHYDAQLQIAIIKKLGAISRNSYILFSRIHVRHWTVQSNTNLAKSWIKVLRILVVWKCCAGCKTWLRNVWIMMNWRFKHDWFVINIICHWKIIDDCIDEIRVADKMHFHNAKPISIVITRSKLPSIRRFHWILTFHTNRISKGWLWIIMIILTRW